MVTFDGEATDDLLGMLIETVIELAEDGGPMIVDLSSVTVRANMAGSAATLDRLDTRLLRVVCPAPDTRQVVRGFGVTDEMFCTTVEAAVADLDPRGCCHN